MKKGYTLAEVLIALLVVAIVAAAATPILTKALVRQKASNERPWTWSGNAAYSNIGDNSSSIIGMNSVPAGNLPKLLINTDFNERNSINFYYGGGSIGSISLNAQGTQFGQYITPATPVNTDNSMVLSVVYNGIVSIGNNPATGLMKGSNSVAIGENTAALTEGVALGANARAGLYSVAMGYNSNAIGSESVAVGANTTTSNYAIAIGSNASATIPYSLVLGVNSSAVGSNSFVIGNNSTSYGNNSIFIGHNVSNTSLSYQFKNVTHTGSYQGQGQYGSSGYVHEVDVTTQTISLPSSDSVIIGSAGMESILVGDSYSTTSFKSTAINAGTITVSSFSNSSDLRLKNLGNEYTPGMDKLNRLKIYNYTFKNEPKKKRVGVVAQELMKIFPDAVSKGADGYYVIRQEDIFYSMVNALKNFDKKIKEITANIANLNKVFARLEAKTDKLIKQVQKNSNDIEDLKKEINSLELKIDSKRGNN